ncbi:MAG TPA: glycoside hydrolase domain-containing protein [Candidatus Eremiobacteraceae bacterium]|nr:glycoside hydrolase domain-containing protein [Candidatus Eremiobacteraceae bacterium]
MRFLFLAAALALSFFPASLTAQTTYLGFDRNTYPGDANLRALRQTFSYTGYWLNHPPGETTNTWTGQRAAIESAGLGFLLLFNGRLYAELKSVPNATKLGNSDAQTAAAAAHREGFPAQAIIFLDQEQGGRMLPEQKSYIYSWVDGVIAAGFRAGVYCSGIAAKDDDNVVTAEDIRKSAAGREIVYWAINDACPPAPGCALPKMPPSPAQSGISFAEVWQYAQSPQRKDVAARCSNYNHDGNCYPPGIPLAKELQVDLNTANSPDPSNGRSQ